MKKLYALIFVIILSGQLFAQRPGGYGGGGGQSSKIKGKVVGKLIDPTTKEPVPYASIVVTKGEKQINGTMSAEDGSFKISNIPVGQYKLMISFVGYETISKDIEMTPKNPDVNLNKIEMELGAIKLDEVVVEGQKSIIENKIDKIVYNAENDVANAGGDASDVLRRAPLLNVDIEGNVSLRGSQNVQILINGKPSSMFASNPGDALQAIPADDIKSVEVITTPSAKYDGEGTAGIINIITKKSKPEGFTGNVNASAGNRSNRTVVSINAGKGRFGFNTSMSAYYSPIRRGSFDFYREDIINNQSRILKENGPNNSDRLGFFGTASAFYDINAYNAFSSSFRLRGFNSNRDNELNGSFEDQINGISQEYQRLNETDNLFSGYEWSLDYVKKFEKNEEQELSMSYKIDGNVQNQELSVIQQDIIGNDPTLFQNDLNDNDGDNTENTIQIDYVHPINKNMKLETGVKTIIRDVVSDFNYDTLNRVSNQYITDLSRSDIFNYDQNVTSSYISSRMKFGTKYGLIAGIRYEHTEISGSFNTQENTFTNDYDNWLPSVTLSRKLGKATTVKGSFSRRIQRPSLRVINPYVQFNNNRSISFGNPELDPELTDQIEISYGTFVKKFSINASFFYRNTTGIIESFVDISADGVASTTFKNIGENESIGVNLFSSVNLLKNMTVRGGLNIFTYSAEGEVNGQQLSRDAIVWNGNINTSLKLKKGWSIDVFGFYRAPRQTLQGTNPSFSLLTMGAKKQITKKFGLGIRIVEPFFENKNFGGELSGENFTQRIDTAVPFRSFGLNLTYKFGKLDFKQRTRRSKIKNDDQGSGGGDNEAF
jgi:outer membrane receptor protein involved in Fe transport